MSAMVSEIVESVLRTVQKYNTKNKQFTSRQYLYLQIIQKTMCKKKYTHIYSVHTVYY